jgi:hypothetical protein
MPESNQPIEQRTAGGRVRVLACVNNNPFHIGSYGAFLGQDLAASHRGPWIRLDDNGQICCATHVLGAAKTATTRQD